MPCSEKPLAKWKQIIIERINVENNFELITNTNGVMTGGDYDHILSDRQEWELTQRNKELARRFYACGFFTKHDMKRFIGE